jgi:predicted Zn-ribbon and HTH transcriptional regulator
MTHHPNRIYTANNLGEAEVIKAWLAERDVAVIIPDRHATDTVGMPSTITGGIEVCVRDAAQLHEAKALLEEHAEALADHVARAAPEIEPVKVQCEKCGAEATTTSLERSHVIECPKCHEYIDVPE